MLTVEPPLTAQPPPIAQIKWAAAYQRPTVIVLHKAFTGTRGHPLVRSFKNACDAAGPIFSINELAMIERAMTLQHFVSAGEHGLGGHLCKGESSPEDK